MTTIRDIFPGASQPQTLTCGLTDILREEASLLRDADVDKLAASQTVMVRALPAAPRHESGVTRRTR